MLSLLLLLFSLNVVGGFGDVVMFGPEFGWDCRKKGCQRVA